MNWDDSDKPLCRMLISALLNFYITNIKSANISSSTLSPNIITTNISGYMVVIWIILKTQCLIYVTGPTKIDHVSASYIFANIFHSECTIPIL